MRFIDLFSGLGGFHVSLLNLGHECVFASEIDPLLQELYYKNFHMKPEGDIRSIDPKKIPDHEILTAGFPCQPFSKAGEQKGLDCKQNGDLINYVLNIIDIKRPKFILLENVTNLEKHNNGETWEYIKNELERYFQIDNKILSPHLFGIPQIRRRMFIVGSSDLSNFSWPEIPENVTNSVYTILDKDPKNAQKISPKAEKCLNIWQQFIESYPKDIQLPWYPIWSMEFGATYPYEDKTPHTMTDNELRDYKGNHGISLDKVPENNIRENLPSYALRKNEKFPKWKIKFILKNRELYEQNKKWIDEWIPKIKQFPPSYQKFEWNCKGETRNIFNYIIQFRASGVRVKRPTTSPSLVAMTTTQIPIIGWEKRYFTFAECSRLQGLEHLLLPKAKTRVIRVLGNAVNVHVVEKISESLITESDISEFPVMESEIKVS